MKTTYKVLARTGYGGHRQGDTFEAELDPAAEARAIARGSLERVKATTTKQEKEDDDE